MRALLRSMQPDNFEHISAVLALYRPGPMGVNAHNDYADRKNKRTLVKPIHEELAEPLDEMIAQIEDEENAMLLKEMSTVDLIFGLIA